MLSKNRKKSRFCIPVAFPDHVTASREAGIYPSHSSRHMKHERLNEVDILRADAIPEAQDSDDVIDLYMNMSLLLRHGVRC